MNEIESLLDESYTAQEAADTLGLHYVSMIRRLTADPTRYPTAFKWRNKWRIPKAAIKQEIEQLRTSTFAQ